MHHENKTWKTLRITTIIRYYVTWSVTRTLMTEHTIKQTQLWSSDPVHTVHSHAIFPTTPHSHLSLAPARGQHTKQKNLNMTQHTGRQEISFLNTKIKILT